MSAPAYFGRHRRHANPFTVREMVTDGPPLAALFGREAPLAVDVGCGMGSFVYALAAQRPDYNVLGLEIRPHLVDGVNRTAQEAGLLNARALLANANFHLGKLLPCDSVVQLSINFPDPWFKRRHHKRRVLTPELLQALRPKLRPGAQIHVMSDFLPLAQVMRHTLAACPFLRCTHPGQDFVPQSTTGLTSEREIKHQGRGETIYRLLFAYEAGQVSTTIIPQALPAYPKSSLPILPPIGAL